MTHLAAEQSGHGHDEGVCTYIHHQYRGRALAGARLHTPGPEHPSVVSWPHMQLTGYITVPLAL